MEFIPDWEWKIEVEEEWEEPIIAGYFKVLETKVKSFVGSFEGLERAFIEGYKEPERLEVKIKEEDEEKWRLAICDSIHSFYGWGTVSLSDFEQSLKSLSFKAKGYVQRQVAKVINWILGRIIPFFKRFASHLRVRGWSVGGTAGFPLGIGVSISVTFEP